MLRISRMQRAEMYTLTFMSQKFQKIQPDKTQIKGKIYDIPTLTQHTYKHIHLCFLYRTARNQSSL